MKKFVTISTVLGFAILLSACTGPTKRDTSTIVTSPTTAVEKPTPTLNKDNSVESIEADLKGTTVLEEDFSDIK